MENKSPLGEYLGRAGITQTKFAERIARARGYGAGQPLINGWCTGKSIPRRSAQRDIAKATHNKVTPEMWGAWAIANGRVHFPSAAPVVREEMEVVGLAGDLARDVAAAASDGVVTPDEAERIETDVDKLMQSEGALVAAAKGL